MGNIGIAVSQQGRNVNTTADRYLTFSSAFRSLKIYETYTGSTTIPPATGVGGEYNYGSVTDYIEATDSSGNAIDSNVSIGSIVYFDGVDDPPDPLEKNTYYYVVEIVDSSKFKLSTTKGGSVIDILASGSMDSQWHSVDQTNYITFTHNLGYLAPFIVVYNGSSTTGTGTSYFMSTKESSLDVVQSTTQLKIEVDSYFESNYSNQGDTVYFTAYQFLDDFNSYTAPNILSDTSSKATSPDYGFAVSKQGKDVKTCSEEDLVLSSSYFTNEIHMKGNTTSSTVTHNLGYIPTYLGYLYDSSNGTIYVDRLATQNAHEVNSTQIKYDTSLGDGLYYVIFKTAQ
jgi:hypothetical protein